MNTETWTRKSRERYRNILGRLRTGQLDDASALQAIGNIAEEEAQIERPKAQIERERQDEIVDEVLGESE